MIKGTPDLIARRREEIVNACEQLYQTMSFRDITLKEIGKVTSFSRPTIYNYFETKEEIFLALFEREYDRWNEDLETILREEEALSRDQLARRLARSLEKRTQLLKLLSMNNYDMEANSRPELLVSFKQSYGASLRNVGRLLERFCPEMSEAERQRILYIFFPFMFGIYPYTAVTEKQRTAMEEAGVDFLYQSVYELTYACLVRLLGAEETYHTYTKEHEIMNNLPKIALGAWAWGNDGTFGNSLTAESLRPIFDTAMEHGLNLWDTAYAYGMGTSEKILAGFLTGLPRDSYLVSDKFTPQCANAASPTAMADMIEMQLKLMELDRFDIYWIHNVWDAPKWTEELARYFEGKDNVPLLGVSNHNLAEIKQANEILKAHGLRLSAVQNHYSLINRSSEESGILDYCRENGIHFFAYMVLEQGALSGKYDTAHPMPEGSARAQTYNPVLDKLEVLNGALKKLADKYQVGPAQIPVAWAIAKGTLPIIGVTKPSHVEDAVKAANVALSAEETAELEALADSLNINAVRFWEKEMK